MLGVVRSGLRGLILRGGAFVSKPTVTRINQCHALTSFLQCGEYYSTCTQYNELEKEAKGSGGGSSSSPTVKKPAWKPIIDGDVVDLHALLFTENRDYLVKYKDNQKVRAEHLAGKVIVLYFSLLSACPYETKRHITLLEDIYNDLHPRNGFEIVFLAAKDVDHQRGSRKQFEEMFSLMPWTAIPFSDIPSSKNLYKRGYPELYWYPKLLIVNSTGMILQNEHCAYDTLDRYGYTGYPFSDERIFELISEDNDSIVKPCLHTLLASPQRDYVISNKGDKVPIHTLESKVVALYFWPLCTWESILIKMAYEEFRKKKKNFEVVLIYDASADRNKESFWEVFKTMPWLALPYNDPNNKKLRRIFEHSSRNINGMDKVKVPGLVIFGPHGKFIDPCGEAIMGRFGVGAYPFTCAAAVKLEMEKTKDLRLEMLWDQSTVLTGKDGYKVPLSQLCGKRVVVIVEMSYFCLYGDIEFLKMLKEMYLLWKGTCYEFEVIHVVDEGEESSRSFQKTSWRFAVVGIKCK